MATMLRSAGVVCAALSALAETGHAQQPVTREGIWLGLGAGIGSARFTVDGYTVADAFEGLGATFHARMGGTPSARVLIGAELSGWTKSASGVTSTAANVAVVAYFYPSTTAGAFLKGGLAITGYAADDGLDELTSAGFGLVLGAGFDIPLRANFSITPSVGVWVGGGGDLEDHGFPVAENWRHTILELAVGVTFH